MVFIRYTRSRGLSIFKSTRRHRQGGNRMYFRVFNSEAKSPCEGSTKDADGGGDGDRLNFHG